MKPQNLVLAAAAAIALAAGAWLAQYQAHPPTPEVPADNFIDFTLPDLADQPRRLGEWRGKLILLNFWATWCTPCREEIPLFVDTQRQYGGRGFQIVGVAMDNKTAVQTFAREFKINYPLLLGDAGLIELMARYGNANGGLPFSVMINPEGAIVARKIGAYHQQDLHQLIQQNLSAIGDKGAQSLN